MSAAIEILTLSEPRTGEVLVRLLASGVCHSDLHVGGGDWPRPTPSRWVMRVRASSKRWDGRTLVVGRAGRRPVVARAVRRVPVMPPGASVGRTTPPCTWPAGLPVERLIDRRIGLDEIEGAFDRLRNGEGLRQVVVFP